MPRANVSGVRDMGCGGTRIRILTDAVAVAEVRIAVVHQVVMDLSPRLHPQRVNPAEIA